MIEIGFIGAGTVGTALAQTLAEANYRISCIASRSFSSAMTLAARLPACAALSSPQSVADKANLIFITTPDDTIASVAAGVNWRAGQSVVHCSGVASVDILFPASQDGAQVGCFHPLQSFANVDRAVENIPGSTFAVEAELPLRDTLSMMAKALHGKPVVLAPGDKVLYHTAAVIVSNYAVVLMKMATDLWQLFGVDTPDATAALMPLLRGTVNNVESIGLPNCLTGPLARGDGGTIKKHLEALAIRAPHLVTAYRELGHQGLAVALAKGKIDSPQAERMRLLLDSIPSQDVHPDLVL